MKILVTPTSLQPNKGGEALKVLQEFSNDLVFNELGRPLTEDELIPLLKDCDGYVAGLDYVTEKVISSCPNLKVISRYGAGYDRVDIAAAKANGIPVTNTPGVNAEAVGELAFSLILSLARRIPYLNQSTRSGEWVRSTGMELKGKTIGIMGLGAIGKVVARCARGFEMNILAYDPYIDKTYCAEHNIGIRTFDEMIEEADVISLHLPLTDSTRHLINSDTIARMKPSAILINTSRGGIIDEDAACHALRETRLGGLGLDAFEIEPPTESKLFELDNVVVTPHTGAHTKEATENMAYGSIKNLIDVLSGKECPFIVNR
ncbi:phosphoglycerate dehydrogenase [Faecalicatena contorta]|uniref:D-3-phosphoglycerate dehydrogenase n=1 Tax=Faecalicatena contorta TaxID=39482 RepID=A0A315ZU88_9FIRM|nr:phosphoglycerate dehydrogenase [Faecalicatena contorta]PWJ48500.1 D-3-phosphoglycerate dehydrogenase [Faecalicatena contorta]SUQ15236.1 D-3-phosphoglycerate dehydrogenase [Faecalicatena contorta]